MQTLVRELQQMIKTYYGLNSDIELKPCHSYQTLKKESFSFIENSLTIPLHEPKTNHPIAFFKIYDVDAENKDQQNRLYDLVHLTLQSHINLLDELDVAESLLQYMQVELNPKKVIRLRANASATSSPILKNSLAREIVKTESSHIQGTEILLICANQQLMDQLALEIHTCAGNHFFIRSDYMSANFMTSINDLLSLSHTTLYIPSLDQLTPVQQKSISTYLMIGKPEENGVVVICGSQHTITKMSASGAVDLSILKHLNVFNILRDHLNDTSENPNLESLKQCAHTILGANPSVNNALEIKTKSYHLIPSLNDLFPTMH
jgi:hypothetical protein